MMSLEELNQLKDPEEVYRQALMSRFQQLQAAAARLSASQMAVSELSRIRRKRGYGTFHREHLHPWIDDP
jgi:hypothetical protein